MPKQNPNKIQLFHASCYGLKMPSGEQILENSIDALITDPPYGINYQNNKWDDSKNGKIPTPDPQIWKDCFNAMKSGAYGLVFSFPRVMHRLMVHLEEAGFEIKDVLFWVYLNGMPKIQNIGVEIDKELGAESTPTFAYKYEQGYKKNGAESYTLEKTKKKLIPTSDLGKKYQGAGVNLKPAYEPIILIKKPIEKGLNVAQNIIKYGVGALNLEETRIPYAEGEGKVGHNPHPKGRVAANIVKTDDFEEEYNKFFAVAKVRQKAEEFNTHPTIKPIELMEHLVKLISWKGQKVLDPFMGSGSTGVACLKTERQFIGYELEKEYFEIVQKRMDLEKKKTL